MADLAIPEDIADYPGAPFPASLVEAACAQVRADCGWHIAPQVSETLEVDSDGGPVLLLPSMHVVSVLAVRHVRDSGPVDLSGWSPRGPRVRAGVLVRTHGYWPRGLVEVDVVHGYESCPVDLLPVIAARAQRAGVNAVLTQRSETVGARTASEAYNINRLEIEAGSSSGLERYKLPRLP